MDEENQYAPQSTPPWPWETAQILRDNGHITDETIENTRLKHPGWGPSDGDAPPVSPGAPPPQDIAAPDSEPAPAISPAAPPPEKRDEGTRTQAPQVSPAAPPPPQPEAKKNPDIVPADLKPSEPAAAMTLASDGQQFGAGQQRPQGPSMEQQFAGLTAGFSQEQDAARKLGDIGAAKALEHAAFLDRTQAEDSKRFQANQDREQARQDKLDAQFEKLQKATVDLQSQKIDPDRLWANASTGDKVMAGIGLFLGAFGGTGVNAAVTTMNDAINRDIKVQQANIDNKKAGVDAEKGLYADMFSRFKDKRAAEDATRFAYLDNAQMTLKAMDAKYSAPEMKAKAQALIGQLEQQKIGLKVSFMQSMAKTLPVGPEADRRTLTPEQNKLFVDGYGMAPTEDEGKKARATLASVTTAKDGIRSLLGIIDKSGKSVDPQLIAQAEATKLMLQGALREEILGPGTVQENERKILDQLIADPTKMLSRDKTIRTTLTTVMDRLDKSLAFKMKSLGLAAPAERLGFKSASK